MEFFDRSNSGRTTNGPPACPACKSLAVTTSARHLMPMAIDDWERCGEVWNIGRRDDRPTGAIP